jgi:hypothetical protein
LGTGVWDRSIIDHLFSPVALAKVAKDPSADPLAMSISDIKATRARKDPDMTLKEAAGQLMSQKGQCLKFDGKVATPWDVIMKPWIRRKLSVLGSRKPRSSARRRWHSDWFAYDSNRISEA